jgi:hypothetical protein
MLDGNPRLFSISQACADCPLSTPCGAQLTDYACPDAWSATGPGGAAVSHPLKPGTLRELKLIGGATFDDIQAHRQPAIELPGYLPQLRNRSALRGAVPPGAYAIRATDVIKKRRVISAQELRERLDLPIQHPLVLLLFDRDRRLEEIWRRSHVVVPQIAEAGYSLVSSPSFSTYEPRPRTEYLINMRRSMLFFRWLQSAGAPTIPRVAWQVEADVRRIAQWVSENPDVSRVGIDLSTYRWTRTWRAQLDCLRLFDGLVGHRLSYLINGLTTEARCRAVFDSISPSRVTVTNATTQARIAPRQTRTAGDQSGVTFQARLAARYGVVIRAHADSV